MPIIKINDLICTSYGSPAARYREDMEQEVFLNQGSLDGACGVYCLFMGLLMLGLVDRESVASVPIKYGNTRTGKLLRSLSKQGPFVQRGVSVTDMENHLRSSFGRQVQPQVAVGVAGTEVRKFVQRNVSHNRPVILGTEWSDSAHWVLVIGIEYDNAQAEQPKRFLILDPGESKPVMCAWNSAIDVVGTGGPYPYKWPGRNSKVGFFAALSM